MAETQYWFARYNLNPEGRGLRPLGWQGFAVIGAFVVAMIGGGLACIALSLGGFVFAGIATFVVCAIAGASFFIWAAVAKKDPKRTVADYQTAGLLK